jgi:hypothetical protein
MSSTTGKVTRRLPAWLLDRVLYQTMLQPLDSVAVVVTLGHMQSFLVWSMKHTAIM